MSLPGLSLVSAPVRDLGARRRALAVACLMLATMAAAQPYPAKPLRVIVPSVPGGNLDLVARSMAQQISPGLRQQVVVENRAGSTVGARFVAKAPPDGYTLLMGNIAHTINMTLYRKLNYNFVKDFSAVSLLASAPNIVVVHPSVPVKSIKELVALARSRPGALDYASSGSGSSAHLAAVLLLELTKTKMNHVPYKGGGPAVVAAVSGEVNAIINSPAVVLPHVKSGRLRGLAVTSARRSEIAPDLPALAEGLPGYEVQGWYGVFAPRATPRRIVGAINTELDRYGHSAEGRARLLSFGLVPTGGAPEAFAEYFRLETERWVRVIRAAGIKSD
jgi:tripartite-type tricarboxylate transporter receptor subunit TctC